MDKIAKVPHLREELDWLDQTYGVEKEGFFHQEHWQLLVAIMLSAQSTDKQVDEVLPKLYGPCRRSRRRQKRKSGKKSSRLACIKVRQSMLNPVVCSLQNNMAAKCRRRSKSW